LRKMRGGRRAEKEKKSNSKPFQGSRKGGRQNAVEKIRPKAGGGQEKITL